MSRLWAGEGAACPTPPPTGLSGLATWRCFGAGTQPLGSLPKRRPSWRRRYTEQLHLRPSCRGFWQSASTYQLVGSISSHACAHETVRERETNAKRPRNQQIGGVLILWRKPQIGRYRLCPPPCCPGPSVSQPAGRFVGLSLLNFLADESGLLLLCLQRGRNKTLCSRVSGSCRVDSFTNLRPRRAPTLIGQAPLWPSAPPSTALPRFQCRSGSWLPASSCLHPILPL